MSFIGHPSSSPESGPICIQLLALPRSRDLDEVSCNRTTLFFVRQMCLTCSRYGNGEAKFDHPGAVNKGVNVRGASFTLLSSQWKLQRQHHNQLLELSRDCVSKPNRPSYSAVCTNFQLCRSLMEQPTISKP